MKRSIFILLFSLTIVAVKAQTGNGDKISFATTIGTGLHISKPSSTPFIWQVIAYYKLSGKWSVGAGTGLSFYEKMLVPVYGDIRFQIGRERKFIPYAGLGAGYSFATAGDANGGFFMNPSIGLQYPLKNKMKLQLAIGYELQKLERLKTQTDDYFYKEFAEKLNHHMISIKLGLSF
ncbi:MAG: hypothetical protein LBQ60_16610 [Bacteroidales bacterium]|jgi:hypothetical protein|nr:hypothetical protein [Bacteroidales bacterium]